MSSDGPILYVGEKNISSWSMRAWVALRHKGVAFEARTISLVDDKDRGRRRTVSPTGRVPVLHHAGRVIPDSLAIVEYLEETFPPPSHPALWPRDAGRRAHARWLAAAMHAGFFQIREHMSFNWCFLPEKPSVPAAALQEADEMLGYWEAALEDRTETGPFLFGAFGGADAMYAPAVVRLAAFQVPTGRFPLAAAYMKAVLEAPAVKPWLDAARSLPPQATY
jgi:glutathione S-transferase